MTEIPPKVRCKDADDNNITCSVMVQALGDEQVWNCASKSKWGESMYEKGRAGSKLAKLPLETYGNALYVVTEGITKNTICQELGKNATKGLEEWSGSEKKFFPFWKSK